MHPDIYKDANMGGVIKTEDRVNSSSPGECNFTFVSKSFIENPTTQDSDNLKSTNYENSLDDIDKVQIVLTKERGAKCYSPEKNRGSNLIQEE